MRLSKYAAVGILLPAISSLVLAKVDFTKDIRPILSDKCFACHGPDESTREAKLRLDTEEGALADLAGVRAVVPGKPDESELLYRIISKDADEVMPPPDSHKKPLSKAQIKLFRQWIAEGAKYEMHWSYKPLVQQSAPKPKESEKFVKSPIDAFILQQAKSSGNHPAKEADPITLVRRLFLDLVGVPPTPEEAAPFLTEPSEHNYKLLVDKLLDDPRYGERMAVPWLDLVRFADTIGYHSDNFMEVSAYRDYVIGAFNRNLPYDQFVIENIAGDLLPDATPMQKVASGYNRLLQTTQEGGAQADEYVTIYQADRVRNFGSVWLAATTGCAQCHDHKYDPYTIKDFYSLAAFFADVKEKALGRRESNLKLSKSIAQDWLGNGNDEIAKIDALREQRVKIESDIRKKAALLPYSEPETDQPAQTIEKVWIDDTTPQGAALQGNSPWKFVTKPEPVHSGVKSHVREAKGLSQHFFDKAKDTLEITTNSKLFTYVFLDTLNPPKQIMLQFNDGDWEQRAYWGESKISWGNEGTVSRRKMGPLPETGKWVRLEVETAHVGLKPGTKISGWAFSQFDGKVYWDKSGIFSTTDPSKDPSFSLKLWTEQNKNAKNLPRPVQAAIKVPAEKRNKEQQQAILGHYLSQIHTPTAKHFRKDLAKVEEIRKKEEAAKTQGERPMLVAERTKPRMVRILPRGDWLDKSGEEVQPAIPTFLGTLETGDRRADRMDLAKWVVDKSNPMTARAFVNRTWKLFFGHGLSRRLDDLGGQGEPPTHPELLDYLAADFRDNGWNVKRLVRKLVLSSTYRQGSRVSKELMETDPANRLFVRQARYRLDAEFVRDTALHLSGLLASDLGGASVKPYQPAGYWQHLNFPRRSWKAGQGKDLYRRSLYTFICRSFPHPAMVAFDAPSREECVAERPRSNIPQQALVLLNDPIFVEAARSFAERIMRESKGTPEQRLEWAYQQVLTRKPHAKEKSILTKLLDQQKARYAEDETAAKDFLATGSSTPSSDLPPQELAAWTAISRALFNLYETTARF